MEAAARLVVDTVDGRMRIAVMRSQPPLTLRRTGPTEVAIVGTAAGPLGGDRLALEVVVGAGTALAVRSVAAMIALPGAGGGESRLDVTVTVGPGARLDWAPQPTVAAARCRHATTSRIALADETSHLRWADLVVRGRSGERAGTMRQRTDVDRAGRPLLRTEVVVGADPAVDAVTLGPRRVVAGFVAVGDTAGPAAAGEVDGADWARHPLAADAVAWTVTGDDVAAVGRALDAAVPAGR